MKQVITFIFILSFVNITTQAQAPVPMFWALNKSQLLLDQLSATNASMAYSIRKLKKSYTGPAIRVRKGAMLSGASADVNFNEGTGMVDANSEVTITAAGIFSGLSVGSKMPFSTFYSGTSVYVSTWYDQSGNGRHVSQSTSGQQPRIVNAGSLEMSNSRPSILFISSNSTVLQVTAAASSVFTSGYIGTISAVSEASAGNTSAFGYGNGSNRWQVHLNEAGFIKFDVGNSYTRLASTSSNSANQDLLRNYLFIASTGSPSLRMFVSGVSAGTSSTTLNACSETVFNIGGIPGFSSYYHNSHQSEVIVFSKALTANEISIVDINQQSFFGTP